MGEIAIKTENSLPATISAVNGIKERMNLVTSIYREIMEDGQDYGKITGCGEKPCLLKPGAEKLMMAFKIAPAAERVDVENLGSFHRDYRVTISLTGCGGEILGSGVGSCSTMETKYRYRDAKRKCPECGKESIIKGRKEYGGGWLCFKKNGGCGAKFLEGDKSIEGQEVGKIENTDPADQWNTVLKMAKKRALVDACLTCLGASTMFTQDIEDLAGVQSATVDTSATVEPAEPHLIMTEAEVFQGRMERAGKKGAESFKVFMEIVNKFLEKNNCTMEELTEANYATLNAEIMAYKPEGKAQ